jgi:uncharacterized membrane protein
MSRISDVAYAGTDEFSDTRHRPVAAPEPNVAQWERVASGVGGGLLILKGLDHGGVAGLGLLGAGAALVYRGISGNCSLYRELGINTADHQDSFKGVKFDAAVTINKPRDEVYRRYRNFTQHSQFSNTIIAVNEAGEGCTHWTVAGPFGRTLAWDAEIITDRPGEICSWRSTEQSSVRNAGSVRFSDAPGDRGTEVEVTMSFEPPMGPAGRAVARLLQGFPAEWAQQELMRFKRWMETGQPEGA